MDIKFNLSPGDSVWIMYNNQIRNGIIDKASYIKNISCVDFESVYEATKYEIRLDGRITTGPYTENEIFKSKEDLIKSL